MSVVEPTTLTERVAAVREWVETGIAETLEEDPSGFLLGIASVGVLAVLDEVAEELRGRWSAPAVSNTTESATAGDSKEGTASSFSAGGGT